MTTDNTDTARDWECTVCGTPLRIAEAAAHIATCCPDPPSRAERADLADIEDDADTSPGYGDSRPYRCPRCPATLPLSELLDHMAIAHPNLEPTR